MDEHRRTTYSKFLSLPRLLKSHLRHHRHSDAHSSSPSWTSSRRTPEVVAQVQVHSWCRCRAHTDTAKSPPANPTRQRNPREKCSTSPASTPPNYEGEVSEETCKYPVIPFSDAIILFKLQQSKESRRLSNRTVFDIIWKTCVTNPRHL